MKKIYIIALATLISGSAIAAERMQMSGNLDCMKRTKNAGIEMAQPITSMKLTKKNAGTRAEEINWDEMEGEWEFSYINLNKGEEETRSLTIEIINEETGEIAISGWVKDKADFVLPAKIDPETLDITLPNNYYLGYDKNGYQNWFYVKTYYFDDNENLVLDPGAADVEAATGKLYGYSMMFDESQVWAIGEPDNEAAGWWLLSAMNLIRIPKAINESWINYGTATFEDGWIIPGTGNKPEDMPWTVNVAKNTAMPGLYYLNNPYIAEGSELKHMAIEGGYIMFNISDPEMVIVYPGVFSGFNHNGRFYNFNAEGGYYVGLGYSAETIKHDFLEADLNLSNYNKETGVVTIYNCVFDTNSECSNFQEWTKDGVSLAPLMTSKITFDIEQNSVGTIGAEKLSKVEYYNLQGMPVENPAKGEILIKRTANGAVKTIIK